MPDWAAFASIAGVVLVLLLILARASQTLVSPPSRDTASDADPVDEDTDAGDDTTVAFAATNGGVLAESGPESSDRRTDGADDPGTMDAAQSSMSTPALLANVALSQGLFGTLLLLGAWLTEIPPAAFGVTQQTTGLEAVGLGLALGVALYVANEVGAAVGEQYGLGGSEELRSTLAPESFGGWVILLFVVLPIIAGFEELLFRGALVGVASAGFGLSPWLLAAVSSVAFALGHGAQGPGGVAVTGTLGFVLAAAFVLTQSLLVVVVAHYLVNALEFVVHEGLGVEWTGRRTA
ncbi:MAG: CPBP family intramembrane glutamic endopeptidase [Halobacteriota archaeon]